MKKYRKLIIPLCAPLLILILLYGSTAWFASLFIEKKLTQAGFSDIHVVLQRPTFNTWNIDTLQFSNTQIRAQIKNMQFHYQWKMLLSGQLDQVMINQLELHIFAQKNTNNIAPQLPSWPVLPIHQIDIHQLKVHFPSEKPTIARGSLHFNQDQLQAKLVAHQENKKSGLFRIMLDKKGELNIIVTKTTQNMDQTIISTRMQLDKIGARWFVDAKTDIDIDLLLESIVTWVTIPKILQQAKGHVSATWQLQAISQHPIQTLQGKIQTSGLLNIAQISDQTRDLSFTLRGSASCRLGLCDWSLQKNNQFSAQWKTKQATLPVATHISETFNGQWSWHDKRFSLISGELSIDPLQTNVFQSNTVQVKPVLTLQKNTSQTWSLEQAKIEIHLNEFKWKQYKVTTQRSSLNLHTHHQNVSLAFANEGFHLISSDTSLQSEFQLETQFNLTNFSLEKPIEFIGKNIQARWKNKSGYSPEIRASLKQTHHQTTLTLNATELNLDLPPLQPVPITLNLEAILDPKNIHAILKLQSKDQRINITGKAQHQRISQTGVLQLDVSPLNFDPNMKLSHWIHMNEFPFEIQQGSVALQSQIRWLPDMSFLHQSRIQFKEIVGQIKDITFQGFSSQLALSGNEQQIHSNQPIHFILDKTNIGFPITNIQSDIMFQFPFQEKPSLQMSKIKAHLLGGVISSPNIDLNLNREHNPFQITVDRIDIAEILKLRKEQDIFALGKLSGHLPFQWTTKGLSLNKGQLSSPRGIIRYSPKQSIRLMASNNQMQLLLDAFSDFRYHRLKTNLHYQHNGLMNAKIQLSGKNNTFQNGRTVNLNVNLEENIRQLIRSLQMADDIGDRLGRKAQQILQK